MYIWGHTNWPHFEWDEASLRLKLDAVRLLQGRLLGNTEAASVQADLEVEMDALIQNAIRTSEVQGEHPDTDHPHKPNSQLQKYRLTAKGLHKLA